MEDWKTKLQEVITKEVGSAIQPLMDKVTDLEKKAVPQAIHTKGHIVDDGYLQQIGDDLYRLPEGAVINTSFSNINSKGLRRMHGGIFEKAGDSMLEFADKVKFALKSGNNIKFVTKTVDVSTAMSSADDSSAGLFVPEDVRYALLQIAPPGTVIWPRAQIWPMVTDKIQWPKLVQDPDNDNWFGGVQLRWTNEGGTKQTTTPQFTMLTLECHELSGLAPVTDQLLQDAAVNIGNLLVQLFQGAYWHWTDKYFFQGQGGAQPMGILNAPNIPIIPRITEGRVGFRDLLNMQSQLPPMYDANAIFMMEKEVFNSLRKEVDSNGRPMIDVGIGYNNFGEGVAGYAAGVPIVMSDYKTSALGAKGDVVLCDPKHYFVGERKTLSVEMSRHFYFDQNMTAFRCSARVGGTVEQEQAFVILDSTADPTNMS